MSSIRQGISTFLQSRIDSSQFLISKWNQDLESQFLVHPGSVEVDGTSKCWTDGSEVWANHRWPYKAGSDPNYRDKDLKFSPASHLSRVGSTWWNWKKKKSIAVAFDIDTTDDHAATTTTVNKSQIDDIIDRLGKLDYVTLVRSTGGSGIHIYVFFDETDLPDAINHNEHTQVALATLEKMKRDANYDFSQHMDVKGVVFWFWSDTSGPDHPGFELVKESTNSIGAAHIAEWMGASLKSPNRKLVVKGFDDNDEPTHSEVEGGGYKVRALDETHKTILKELEKSDYTFIWNAEYNMAHTHTIALKELFDRLKEEGRPLIGIFFTTSSGTSSGSDKTKPNCYITPREDGAFQVKRFGSGITEHESWMSSGGDTWCYFNHGAPVLQVLKKKSSTMPKDNQYVFEAKELESALTSLGHTLGDSHKQISSAVTVSRKRDGSFHASIKEQGNFDGWVSTKEGMTRSLPIVQTNEQRCTTVLDEVDAIARNLVTPQHEPYGWALKTSVGWVLHGGCDAIMATIRQLFGKESNFVRSLMDQEPWVLCNYPFDQEYPTGKGRLWNKFAPQLSIEPADKPGPHPSWDMIHDHLGYSLDDSAKTTEWCQQWGITSGGDYLRFWLASLIQFPKEPLPYLFFYGPQYSGKSMFHESASILFTLGSVESCASALTNSQGFNFEIANAVIGFVEEKELAAGRDGAYARMKEWITGRRLTVIKKGETPYSQPNFLKMVHMANSPTACPMEDGDTRITAIAANILTNRVPPGVMNKKLREEAPFFLRTLLTTHLPESPDRLRVPMLSSADKAALESMNQLPWESFAAEAMHSCEGGKVKFTEFYEKYYQHCISNAKAPKKSRAILQLIRNRSDKYQVGLGPGKQMYIANVSLSPDEAPRGKRFEIHSGRLVRCTE